VGFIRKYLSTDGLLSIVKHGLRREKFKVIKNTEYSWEDCIMSGLAVFGFKMPSLYWNIGKQRSQANGNILAGSPNSISQKKMFIKSCVPGAPGGESRTKRSIP